MKDIKKMTSLCMPALFVLALLFQSFTASNKHRFSKEELNGRELFKAIYFNAGHLRNNLEVISEIVSDEEISESNNLKIDKLIDQIDGNNPTFFAEFETTITSGDVNKIQETLIAGSQIMLLPNKIANPSPENNLHPIKTKENHKKSVNQNIETVLPFDFPVNTILFPFPMIPDLQIIVVQIVQTSGNISSILIDKNALFTEKLAIQVAETFGK